MRLMLMIPVVAALAAPVAAEDRAATVTTLALQHIQLSIESHRGLPAIVAGRTSGGAEQLALTALVRSRGTVIGGELVSAYKVANAGTVDVRKLVPASIVVSGSALDRRASYDWAALEKELPGVASVVFLSHPAFDEYGTVAVVRADVVVRNGDSFTSFVEVDRDVNGTWKADRTTMTGLAAAHDASDAADADSLICH